MEDNNDNKPASSQTAVLEIQCPSASFHDAVEFLSSTDTTAYCPGSVFIPANYARTTSKATFQLALSHHHSQISKQTTIPIEGLHPDTANAFNENGDNLLDWLSLRINQRSDNEQAFISLQPTAQTDNKGKWFIISSTSMIDLAHQRIDQALTTLHKLILSRNLPTFEGVQPHRTNNNRSSKLVSNHISRLVQTYGGNLSKEDLPQAASLALQQARTKTLPTARSQHNAWTRKASIAVLNPDEFKTLSETKQATNPIAPSTTHTKQSSPVSTVTSHQATINTDDIAAKIASTLEEKLEQKINNKIDNAIATRVTSPLEKIAQSIENLVQQNKSLNERITKIETYLNSQPPLPPTPQPQANNTPQSYTSTDTTDHSTTQGSPHTQSSFQETPRTPSNAQSRLEYYHDQHHTPMLSPPPGTPQLTSLGRASAKSRSLFSQPTDLETQESTVRDMSILDCSNIDRAPDDTFEEEEIETAVESNSGGAQL